MENNLKSEKKPQEQFAEWYKELVKLTGCCIRAYPIGVLSDKGEFEYRSLEYRIEKISKKVLDN
jgi:hypothetical protein